VLVREGRTMVKGERKRAMVAASSDKQKNGGTKKPMKTAVDQ